MMPFGRGGTAEAWDPVEDGVLSGNVVLPLIGRRLSGGEEDSLSGSSRALLSSESDLSRSFAWLLAFLLLSGSPAMSISSSIVLSCRSWPSMRLFIAPGCHRPKLAAQVAPGSKHECLRCSAVLLHLWRLRASPHRRFPVAASPSDHHLGPHFQHVPLVGGCRKPAPLQFFVSPSFIICA